jgi:hypothetical protein
MVTHIETYEDYIHAVKLLEQLSDVYIGIPWEDRTYDGMAEIFQREYDNATS